MKLFPPLLVKMESDILILLLATNEPFYVWNVSESCLKVFRRPCTERFETCRLHQIQNKQKNNV